ncbi:MAG TPA: NAD(P)/FAD-dependent oxidoreductase, partial [Wenzhouxiangella sp.]|nr:NAD(P)/FAD-dependent oxidoreductase [Wenzhouxiangella sp.]
MSEREIMEYDVVIVGAGPAGLACAIRLKQLKDELNVCVIEKAAEIGGPVLSGAVIEPEPLDALIDGWRDDPPPICVPAKKDQFLYLSKTGKRKLPTPPQQKNHGNFIVSLGAMCAWLAPKAEALGVDLLPGFAAADLAYNDRDEIQGVIIGDMGVDRE